MLGVAVVILGYLSGSVPYGLLITKGFRGVDVRQAGSKNIGATNVARVAGKGFGVLVLLLDVAKGAIPVWVALQLLPQPAWHAAVGLAAFLGHVFPVWLSMKGGKGVATALGVMLVLVPWAALVGFGTYAVLLALFRVSSIGSLAGGLAALATSMLTARHSEYAVLTCVLFLLLLFTHRGNIQRIVKRTEHRV